MTYEPIRYDPGIFGFVKGHRHKSGPSLVMSVWDGDDVETACVYWVARLHHAAKPIDPSTFLLVTNRTMRAAERMYDIALQIGPPDEARLDFQRERVYRWEEAEIYPGHEPLSFRGCQNFLGVVWRKVGRGPEPELTTRLRIQTPMSFSGTIHLPKNDREYHWRKPVLLHEIAHELEFEDKHGPKFVRRYIDLCATFLRFNRRILRETAACHGVVC